MGKPALNRPPRSKRPPEVVRHVGASLEALRKVQESGKATSLPRRGTTTTDRTER